MAYRVAGGRREVGRDVWKARPQRSRAKSWPLRMVRACQRPLLNSIGCVLNPDAISDEKEQAWGVSVSSEAVTESSDGPPCLQTGARVTTITLYGRTTSLGDLLLATITNTISSLALPPISLIRCNHILCVHEKLYRVKELIDDSNPPP